MVVYLHVFSQGAGMGVGIVTRLANIGLFRRMNVHVFLAVTAVGEASLTADVVTHKRFFP